MTNLYIPMEEVLRKVHMIFYHVFTGGKVHYAPLQIIFEQFGGPPPGPAMSVVVSGHYAAFPLAEYHWAMACNYEHHPVALEVFGDQKYYQHMWFVNMTDDLKDNRANEKKVLDEIVQRVTKAVEVRNTVACCRAMIKAATDG